MATDILQHQHDMDSIASWLYGFYRKDGESFEEFVTGDGLEDAYSAFRQGLVTIPGHWYW